MKSRTRAEAAPTKNDRRGRSNPTEEARVDAKLADGDERKNVISTANGGRVEGGGLKHQHGRLVQFH